MGGGTGGTTAHHLVDTAQGSVKPEAGNNCACMTGRILPDRQVFLLDSHVNYDLTAEQLAEITTMAAEEMMRFGIKPKAALLSHSNFGSSNHPSALKMRQTLALLREQTPWLEVDGEMHCDMCLDPKTLALATPKATLAR